MRARRSLDLIQFSIIAAIRTEPETNEDPYFKLKYNRNVYIVQFFFDFSVNSDRPASRNGERPAFEPARDYQDNGSNFDSIQKSGCAKK